jgi:hypothetical protein
MDWRVRPSRRASRSSDFNHPRREIDVDPALLQSRTADCGEVQIPGYVLAVIKLLVKFFSPHRVLPHPSGTGGQR